MVREHHIRAMPEPPLPPEPPFPPPFPPPEPPVPPEPPLPPIPDPPRPTHMSCQEQGPLIRHLAWCMVLAVLIGLGATRSLAQGGPGVMIAVSEQGMTTVKIGEKEQTVSLPEAEVGDKVVCTVKDKEGTWECMVQK